MTSYLMDLNQFLHFDLMANLELKEIFYFDQDNIACLMNGFKVKNTDQIKYISS